MREKTNNTMKMMNKIRATSTDINATPKKPNDPATIARIKKKIINGNIAYPLP
jgi:hypothetical protein